MASLESISLSVTSKAFELSNLLRENNIALPTFHEKSTNDFEELGKQVPFETERQIRQARNALIDGANDLALLAKGPTDALLGLSWATTDSANLGTIVRFNIPGEIPIGGSRTISELAKSTKLREDVVARTVRFAITNGIFREPTEGVFAHSALSARLADSEHMRNIALFSVQELGTWLIQQSETLRQQVEQGDRAAPHAALNVAHPQYQDAFDFFHKETAANERYHRYLEGRTNTSRWAVDNFVQSWGWESIDGRVIVDCGGSIGHSCIALALSVCPEAKFIVQDMNKDALRMGSESVSMNKKLVNRVTFEEHDFFKPQKVVADAYIFRHILHDWNDADSVKIIKALVPALRRGSRVLISEGIMPGPPTRRSATLDNKNVRIEDAFMLAAHDAKERTVSEFETIFKEASPDFRLVGISGGGEGVFQSLVEFEYAPRNASNAVKGSDGNQMA